MATTTGSVEPAAVAINGLKLVRGYICAAGTYTSTSAMTIPCFDAVLPLPEGARIMASKIPRNEMNAIVSNMSVCSLVSFKGLEPSVMGNGYNWYAISPCCEESSPSTSASSSTRSGMKTLIALRITKVATPENTIATTVATA